jgi:hypothetical protein
MKMTFAGRDNKWPNMADSGQLQRRAAAVAPAAGNWPRPAAESQDWPRPAAQSQDWPRPAAESQDWPLVDQAAAKAWPPAQKAAGAAQAWPRVQQV